MKSKYKYVSNIDWGGFPVDYLTIGKVYEFDMEDDYFGMAFNNYGEIMYEFFPNPSHGKWEKVE